MARTLAPDRVPETSASKSSAPRAASARARTRNRRAGGSASPTPCGVRASGTHGVPRRTRWSSRYAGRRRNSPRRTASLSYAESRAAALVSGGRTSPTGAVATAVIAVARGADPRRAVAVRFGQCGVETWSCGWRCQRPSPRAQDMAPRRLPSRPRRSGVNPSRPCLLRCRPYFGGEPIATRRTELRAAKSGTSAAAEESPRQPARRDQAPLPGALDGRARGDPAERARRGVDLRRRRR